MATLIERLSSALRFKAAASAPTNARVSPYAIFAQLPGNDITPRQAWILYKSVGTFAKTVDLIADQVASLRPVVKINGELYDQHDILEFMENPGWGRTRRGLIKELVVQMLVTGTAPVHVIGSIKAPPVALDVLQMRHATYLEGGDGWPTHFDFHEGRRSFRFEREGGRDFRYYQDLHGELLTIYDSQGDDRGVGLSRIQAIRDEVELKLQGLAHNRSLIGKGARLSGVLSFKSVLTPDQKSSIRADFAEQAAGAGNAGGVMVTGGGEADFVNMMMSPRDMDWSALVKSVDETMVARYNVPTTLFSVDAQTHNNYSVAWKMLYDNAVLPAFDVVYSSLARMFSNRLGVEVVFAHDQLSSTILSEKAVERAKSLRESELITTNEARELVGYEPLVGGDVINDMPGLVPELEDIFADHLDSDVIEQESVPKITAGKTLN